MQAKTAPTCSASPTPVSARKAVRLTEAGGKRRQQSEQRVADKTAQQNVSPSEPGHEPAAQGCEDRDIDREDGAYEARLGES